MLFDAVNQRDEARVRAALQAGAHINARNRYDYTPLLSALDIRSGEKQLSPDSIAIVQLLLERGANPNLGMPKGTFPLMSARQSAPL